MVMQVGWSKVADHFERNRYGVLRRSFFVPGTECLALRRRGVRPATSFAIGKRPQSARIDAGVPGTMSVECLAHAAQSQETT